MSEFLLQVTDNGYKKQELFVIFESKPPGITGSIRVIHRTGYVFIQEKDGRPDSLNVGGVASYDSIYEAIRALSHPQAIAKKGLHFSPQDYGEIFLGLSGAFAALPPYVDPLFPDSIPLSQVE